MTGAAASRWLVVPAVHFHLKPTQSGLVTVQLRYLVNVPVASSGLVNN